MWVALRHPLLASCTSNSTQLFGSAVHYEAHRRYERAHRKSCAPTIRSTPRGLQQSLDDTASSPLIGPCGRVVPNANSHPSVPQNADTKLISDEHIFPRRVENLVVPKDGSIGRSKISSNGALGDIATSVLLPRRVVAVRVGVRVDPERSVRGVLGGQRKRQVQRLFKVPATPERGDRENQGRERRRENH